MNSKRLNERSPDRLRFLLFVNWKKVNLKQSNYYHYYYYYYYYPVSTVTTGEWVVDYFKGDWIGWIGNSERLPSIHHSILASGVLSAKLPSQQHGRLAGRRMMILVSSSIIIITCLHNLPEGERSTLTSSPAPSHQWTGLYLVRRIRAAN